MKIIICGNSYWSLENFRTELIKELLKKNDLYLMSTGLKKKLIKQFNEHNLLDVNFDNKFGYFTFLNEIKNLILIFFYYSKIKPDLVLSFNIKPVIYNTIISFFFPQVKIINTITGSGRVFQKKQVFYKLISKLYVFLIRRSDKIFFQNKFDAKLFMGSNSTLKKKSIIVNGSGVNLKKYSNNNLDKLNCNFLFASRLMYIKGVMEYLNAAEIVKKKYKKKVNFFLAGEIKNNDNDYLSSNKLLYYVRKKTIRYLGFQSDIRKIFKKANCVVLPSKLNEGVPRILIEAAASSKFLISSARPGCNSIVNSKYNGFLIKNINKESLAKNMINYLNLPNKLKKIYYKNSKKISLRFYEKDIVNIYLNQINKLKIKNS